MEYRMRIMQEMSLMEKLNILSDAAKYDVACTSSGSNRRGDGKGIGNTVNAGICHSFSGWQMHQPAEDSVYQRMYL